MPLTDYLTRYVATPTDTTDTIVFDPALYYEIFVTDYEDIIRKQVELDQAQCKWDSLIFLQETASAVYGHVCESNTVTPAMRTFADSMGFTGHSSFTSIGTESLNTVDGFRAGCEGLLSSIWENIKKFFKWLWEKIKGFFKAIKAFFMKVLAFFGLVDKPTEAGNRTEMAVKAIDTTLNDSSQNNTDPNSSDAPVNNTSPASSLKTDADKIKIDVCDTKVERVDEQSTAAIIQIVCDEVMSFYAHLTANGAASVSDQDLQRMEQTRADVIGTILAKIKDPAQNAWAKEILTTGTVKLFTHSIAEIMFHQYFLDTMEDSSATLDIDHKATDLSMEEFYKKLTRACKKYMETCDQFSTAIDKIMFPIVNKLQNYENQLKKSSDLDESTPITANSQKSLDARKALDRSILNIEKIITPFSLIVVRSTSNTITTLTRVLREFYTDISAIMKIHKLSTNIEINRARNFERTLNIKKVDTFENINIYLDKGTSTIRLNKDSKTDPKWIEVSDFIQAAVILMPGSNSLSMLVSPGLWKLNTRIRNWILMHELGHIEGRDTETIINTYLTKDLVTGIIPISQTIHWDSEYAADKYAYDRYGEAISIEVLEKYMGQRNGKYIVQYFPHKCASVDDWMNTTINTHPSINNRIARIKSYKTKS